MDNMHRVISQPKRGGNQYTNNFQTFIKDKFGVSIVNFLNDCQTKGYTYQKIADMTDYKVGTIRKYCRRYGIELDGKLTLKKAIEDKNTILDELKSSKLNKYNALSQVWLANCRFLDNDSGVTKNHNEENTREQNKTIDES